MPAHGSKVCPSAMTVDALAMVPLPVSCLFQVHEQVPPMV